MRTCLVAHAYGSNADLKSKQKIAGKQFLNTELAGYEVGRTEMAGSHGSGVGAACGRDGKSGGA